MPDEWTFSRAFAEFSKSRLPERVHEALIQKSYRGELVGHVSRDSTAIEAREKPVKKIAAEKVAVKRGRSKQGEAQVKPPTRIEKQAAGMTLPDMIADLPTACDVGTKQNSKGHKTRRNQPRKSPAVPPTRPKSHQFLNRRQPRIAVS